MAVLVSSTRLGVSSCFRDILELLGQENRSLPLWRKINGSREHYFPHAAFITDALMGTSIALTSLRLKQILKRQKDPGWDASYVPSTLAVRGEAPSISHAHIINCAKLANRDLHLLSNSELAATLLGLYHPRTVGLQEQRMLSPAPKAHPLANFPGCIAGGLPPLRGVVAVAERLNCLKMLPRIWVDDVNCETGKREIIFPHIGDLLWAIRAPTGQLYCVNWSVKDSEEAFKRPFDYKRISRSKLLFPAEIQTRHELERVYYADAGIRTVHVAGSEIDKHVTSNLRLLFLRHKRSVSLSALEQSDLIARFRTCLDTGLPPLHVIARVAGDGLSVEDCCNVFYQSIWRRTLRVDLFHPVLIDRPLRRENEDVLARYAGWFEEKPC